MFIHCIPHKYQFLEYDKNIPIFMRKPNFLYHIGFTTVERVAWLDPTGAHIIQTARIIRVVEELQITRLIHQIEYGNYPADKVTTYHFLPLDREGENNTSCYNQFLLIRKCDKLEVVLLN
jgi:hypothetical protein